MIKGHVYRVRTRFPGQRVDREHLMTYLGEDSSGNMNFDARPEHGTQRINPDHVVSIVPVRHNDGGNQGHYMNKVVR